MPKKSEDLLLKNVASIATLRIPVPPEGGVVVLRGRNGKGKTRALEAIESALGSARGRVDVRDGAKEAHVEAFGVTIKVGRASRRKGELEVETLEGKLSVVDLVDPHIKSPDAADAKRIKALVQLAGAQTDLSLFWRLLAGGESSIRPLLGPDIEESEDLVTMADRVKRHFEAAARRQEAQAEAAQAKANACLQSIVKVDLDEEHDPFILQHKLESAVRAESVLREKSKAAQQAIRNRQIAQDSLEDAEQVGGPSVEVAEAERRRCAETLQWTKDNVAKLDRALQEAKAAMQIADADDCRSHKALGQARQHAKLLETLRDALTANEPESVPEDELTKASQAVSDARTRIEEAAIARLALAEQTKAKDLQYQAEIHKASAEEHREAAKGTDSVLSDAIGKLNSPLRVEQGRLILDTQRGPTFFADLSPGERWPIALDIVIPYLGERGVLTIPQEAWEGLDPVNRRLIASHLRSKGALMITAASSADEEITTEVFTNGS